MASVRLREGDKGWLDRTVRPGGPFGYAQGKRDEGWATRPVGADRARQLTGGPADGVYFRIADNTGIIAGRASLPVCRLYTLGESAADHPINWAAFKTTVRLALPLPA